MSRRKQPNPAKLGDCELKMKPDELGKKMEESRSEKNEEEDEESEGSELGCLDDEDDGSGSVNGRASSPSSSNSSPVSCRSFGLSDATDVEETYTVGATATTPYECNVCKRAFSRSSVLGKHLQVHTDQLQFSCPYCRRLFKHKRSRDRHTKLHTGDKKYKCALCDSAFARSDHLKIHMKTHDNKKPHQCDLCNRGYNTAAALASHQQHHTKKELRCGSSSSRTTTTPSTPSPGQTKCSQIQNKRKLPTPNNDTTVPKQEVDLKIACMYCGKDFATMNLMYQHINIDHSSLFFQHSSLSYVCDLCSMKFDTSQTLREHLEGVHWKLNAVGTSSQAKATDLSRKRKCDEPEDNRKTEEIKNSPSTVSSPYDTNDKPCICSYCYAQMPNFKSFLVHMETHVSLNASSLIGYCPVCGEPGRDPIEFSSHIFGHVVSDATGRCCHQCKKSFDQLDQLQKHHFEAHSQSVYKCTLCGEYFENEIAIQVHFNNKHCNECKHYRCNLCPQQFFHDRLTADLHVSMRHGSQLSGRNQILNKFAAPFGDVEPRLYQSYQCSFCHKMFQDEYLHHLHVLKEHNESREGEYLVTSTSPNFSYKSISPQDGLKMVPNIPCEVCNRSDFTTESELLAHKKLHQTHVKAKIGAVSLQCAYCNEHCKSRSDLENHMKSHQVSCGKGKHKCNICDEIFSSAITLADHKLTHCKIISGNTCTQCKTVLEDEQCFYTHQMQHNNSSSIAKGHSQIPLPANCVICCQTLQTDVEVRLHAKFHLRHIYQKEFLCVMCNKIYENQLQEKNNGVSISICKDCKMTSNGTSYQIQKDYKNFVEYEKEQDVKLRHMEDSNLVCKICRNVFSTQQKLQVHLIEHNFMGMGQYRCYICSSVFTTAAGLQGHIVGHGLAQSPYECTECNMKFFFETELENHRINHAQKLGDSKSEQYKVCENCSGVYLDSFFREHAEVCCKVEIKTEEVDDKPYDKTADDCGDAV
ncbi:zinc finger protein 423 homolog isoform X2 [Onthophagus taurus]|uniref:zinc finger protein 423 homolog isoform X2 n=1 Tax=Onthophagus taurus TaxID=166361 RepID=UPI000C20F9D7|nr:zinc finger protein 423-like isoform X2 [Onthophagus taurus]